MSLVEKKARQLLETAAIKDLPVPVEELAKQLGAQLTHEPFDGNISGMLYREGDRVVIGVNSAHAYTRQRFTVAHEIGHLRLHPGRPIIVDKLVRVNLRDRKSSLATDKEEIEANGFAAALLMPSHLVVREVQRRAARGRSLVSDEWLIEELARSFKVSSQAMEYRLANLGLRVPQ
jgi:Zn-dependent peptidase ImmA (M78 family)